jgi:preprotein translocase subunit SecE
MEEVLPALQHAQAAQGNEVARNPNDSGERMSIVTRTRDFTSEVAEELKKVTWPDRQQLRQATLVMLVFVFIVAIIIWIMDLGVRGVLNVIMNLFAR